MAAEPAPAQPGALCVETARPSPIRTAACLKALSDAAADPHWAAAHQMPPDWPQWNDERKVQALWSVIDKEVAAACSAFSEAARAFPPALRREARRMTDLSKADSGLKKLSEFETLYDSLATGFPYGFMIVSASDQGTAAKDCPSGAAIAALKSEAGAALLDVPVILAQRRDALAKMAAAGAAGLDHAYDNKPLGPEASPAVHAGHPGARPQPLQLHEPPAPESFEALTAGIVFDGPDTVSDASGEKANPARAVFQKALRHLYAAPTGRKVLRDIQTMRREAPPRWAATHGEAEKRLSAMKEPHPLVTVKVRFSTVPEEIGHAQVDLEVSASGEITTQIVLAPRLLGDINPSRAAEMVLAHELRHGADKLLMQELYQKGRWHIFEDRAFFTQAQVIMEQKDDLAKEVPSDAVEILKSDLVRPLLDNPSAFRLEELSYPNYVWELTPADLQDPPAALRWRLLKIYDIWDDPVSYPRANDHELLAKIDPTGEIEAAWNKALAEASRDKKKSKDAKNLLFFDAAMRTSVAKNWLKNVSKLAEEMKKDPSGPQDEWRKKLAAAEDEFWDGVESFVEKYRKEKGR